MVQGGVEPYFSNAFKHNTERCIHSAQNRRSRCGDINMPAGSFLMNSKHPPGSKRRWGQVTGQGGIRILLPMVRWQAYTNGVEEIAWGILLYHMQPAIEMMYDMHFQASCYLISPPWLSKKWRSTLSYPPGRMMALDSFQNLDLRAMYRVRNARFCILSSLTEWTKDILTCIPGTTFGSTPIGKRM